MYTSTDLGKLKQMLSENPECEAALTRLLDSHNETIRAITHEIRNPLTLVYSALQLIEAAHPEVSSFRHWDALHENVLYMVQLLTDLSDYNHGFTLHKKKLDTDAFLKKLVLSFAASSASSSAFTSHIVPGLPPIHADAIKLKEVLLNLLKNAAEAIPGGRAGAIRLEADITGSPETAFCPETDTVHSTDTAFCLETDTAHNPDTSSHMLRIRIQDNGCGIPAEHLADIFQPFVTYKSGGTGLGLPLSKRIIEAHGGCLLVDSKVGEGSAFIILLPLSGSCDCDTE